MIGAIAYALFVEGAAGSFAHFISIPSFLIVIAFVGLTYIKKDKYSGVSAMVVTVLYGYMLGNLVEAFWPKK